MVLRKRAPKRKTKPRCCNQPTATHAAWDCEVITTALRSSIAMPRRMMRQNVGEAALITLACRVDTTKTPNKKQVTTPVRPTPVSPILTLVGVVKVRMLGKASGGKCRVAR